MNDQLKDKLLKLYELAKRGVGGEKVNAGDMLNSMLEKHGLTIEDIDTEIPRKRYYTYTTKANEKIISQIMYRVIGKGRGVYDVIGHKESCAEVTDYEHVQILELIDFHLDNFRKEREQVLDDLTQAYIQKHRLFKEGGGEERAPLTPEEKQALWRILNMKDNLSDRTYQKKIE